MSEKDTLYLEGLPHADFVFDDQVVAVFPDMISRSVPGYSTIIAMIGSLSAEYALPNTFCYDLGCSWRCKSFHASPRSRQKNCSIITLDNSEAMVQGCREAVAKDSADIPMEVRCENILESHVTNASMVVMNFTLQFVQPQKKRDALISKIYEGSCPRVC